MRSIHLAAVSAIAVLAFARSAAAFTPTELDVYTLASAHSGPTAPTDTQQVQTHDPNAKIVSKVQDAFSASFAHADATATFSVLHAYADAFDNNGESGQAQATAYATYIDYFNGSAFAPNVTNHLTFDITGSTSAQPQFGPGPAAIVTWRIDDLTSRDTLVLGSWTDSNPVTHFNVPFVVPAGDFTRLYVDIDVFAYDGSLSQPGVVYSDFENTVVNYIVPGDGGPDVIGDSGHNYAVPLPGVPEPGAWALMILGFGAIGGALRRRRMALAPA